MERQFDSQKKLYSFFRENGELSEGNLVNELFRICSALYPQLQHVAMIGCENGKGSFTARNSGKAELINGDISKPVKREKRISIKFMNDTRGKTESVLLDYLYGFDDDISVFADEIVLNSLTNKIIFVYVFPDDFKPECCLDFLASLNFVTSFFTLKKKYLINQDAFEKQLIFPMIKILELYDPFILGHSENVARYASLVSEGLDLNSRDKIILYWSSQVHDIGKIMVPSTILRKTGRYTAQEYEILKMHAQWGGEILSASQELSNIACFVRHH
ncbi:MAG: HD domain-containing protein, partial [Smithellaceae bacterium]|nr:HD domain-containing protein [Smithellaceae bacterium]